MISASVIKTLEPLIDSYIEKRLYAYDQKMLDIQTKIEYISRCNDLKLELYQ